MFLVGFVCCHVFFLLQRNKKISNHAKWPAGFWEYNERNPQPIKHETKSIYFGQGWCGLFVFFWVC
jgi:hypothetical protein